MKSFFTNLTQSVHEYELLLSSTQRKKNNNHEDSDSPSSLKKRKLTTTDEDHPHSNQTPLTLTTLHTNTQTPSPILFPSPGGLRTIPSHIPSNRLSSPLLKKSKTETSTLEKCSPPPPLQTEQLSLVSSRYHVTKTFLSSPLLHKLPTELLQHTLSYLNTDPHERQSIVQTCKMFHVLSHSVEALRDVDLFKNHARILYDFSPASAAHGVNGLMLNPSEAIHKLLPFAKCSNVQALYLIGMIRTFCSNVLNNTFQSGIAILYYASKLGDARSSYSLGIILRDGCKAWSASLMNSACEMNYIPACQETLSPNELKDRYGDLSAATLEKYMDPIGLNRLLKQYYINCPELRFSQTSHCWNPLCGRWAYKATNPPGHLIHPPVFIMSRLDCKSEDTEPSSRPSKSSKSIDSALDSILLSDKVDLYSSQFASTLFAASHEDICKVTSSSLSPQSSLWPFSKTYVPMTCVQNKDEEEEEDPRQLNRGSRMKMCSSCRRAKYCSKLCQVYDWRSGRHRTECHFIAS